MPPTIAHGRPITVAIRLLAGAMLAAAWSHTASAQRAAPPPSADDPFARRGWHLELGGRGALEAWNYNISHEELFGIAPGLTYGLRNGLVLTLSWPLTYVSQRGVDAYVMGATFGVRERIYRRRRWSLFLGGELGVSEADTIVPPRGTRFNYLAQGTVGATVRLARGLHALAGIELTHVSNGGHAGRNRNPDIEAIGPRVGVLMGF
jgi:opacity protein-like surface antigen